GVHRLPPAHGRRCSSRVTTTAAMRRRAPRDEASIDCPARRPDGGDSARRQWPVDVREPLLAGAPCRGNIGPASARDMEDHGALTALIQKERPLALTGSRTMTSARPAMRGASVGPAAFMASLRPWAVKASWSV